MAREDTEEKHMQKRILALLLVLALGCSLLATAAFAEEDTETAAPVEETQATGEAPVEETLPPLTETSGAQQSVLASAADGVTVGAENPGLTVPQPDEVGQLSYANLESAAQALGMRKMEKSQIVYIRTNQENKAVVGDRELSAENN